MMNSAASKNGRSLLYSPKCKEVSADLENLFLQELLDASILPVDDWLDLPGTVRDELAAIADKAVLLHRLVGKGLLTEYQSAHL